MKRIERCVFSRASRAGRASCQPLSAAGCIALAFALLFGSGCRRGSTASKESSETKLSYGEPIGIRVSGPNVPALLAAVAVSEQHSADAFVGELASLLYAAVVRCPQARDELTAGKPLALRLATQHDLLFVASRETDAASDCLGKALVGKALPGAASTHLMIRLGLDPHKP